jgi:hypothetical protein
MKFKREQQANKNGKYYEKVAAHGRLRMAP